MLHKIAFLLVFRSLDTFGEFFPLSKQWRGTVGREPGRIGAGGVGEAGGERTGSGIPKVAGTGRKGEKFCNIA